MLDPRDDHPIVAGIFSFAGCTPAQSLPAIASQRGTENAPRAQISASSSQLITDNNV